MDDEFNFTNDDYESDNEYDDEYLVQQDICYYNDLIDEMYDSIIHTFKIGDDIVYKPNIFNKLTKEMFRSWIIANNPILANKILVTST